MRVVELAKTVAESDRSELRIVSCLGHWTSDHFLRWTTSELDRHDHRLARLLARCDLSRVRYRVSVRSEAAAEIVAALCADVDVLVMGTVWRSGPAGVLIADAAREALARVDCSVLAVKPDRLIVPPRFGGRLLCGSSGVTPRAA